MSTYLAKKQAATGKTFARLAAKGLLVAAAVKLGGVPGPYDPVTDTTPTIPAHTVNLAGFRYQGTDAIAQTMVNQSAGPTSTIATTKELLLIQGTDLPKGVEPAESDAVEIAGEAWDITQVASDPLKVTYTLALRRA